jgi:curved DNA-binding protein CbpA
MTTMSERRRTDLYRILGVPALASGEMIRQRWLEVAKRHHPDVGGDGTHFRYAKQAYEVLRDPDRRAEYERFWLQALGPFERVAAEDDLPALEAVTVAVRHEPAPAAPPPEGHDGELGNVLGMMARLFDARRALDERIAPGPGGGLGGLLARVERTFAAVRADELDTLVTDVRAAIAQLESVRTELNTLAELKRAVGA